MHRHIWVEDERFHAPPTEKDVNGVSTKGLYRAIFGITTTLYHCAVCGKIKTVEILGKKIDKKDNDER